MEDKSLEFDFKTISFVDDAELNETEMNFDERKEYIIEVDFKGSRKGYFVNSKSVSLKVGDFVILECDNGEDMGVVSSLINKNLRQDLTEDGEIIRKGNPIDIRRLEENRKIEDKILIESRKHAKSFKLDMKFIDIEYKFDRKKLVFYFTADGRVDFRELVKVFAAEYRTRIELRQIGVRDEAQRIGGIGICGRELCCSKFLKNFVSINVAMARDQNLFVKPEKFSGACGKLMCCLKYEHEFYLNAKKGIPEIGTVIKTTKGTWFVNAIDVFKKTITLSSASSDMITYTFEQVGELITLLSPNSIIASNNGHSDSNNKSTEPREGCTTCKDGGCSGSCKVSDIDLMAFKKKLEQKETPHEDINPEKSEFSMKNVKKAPERKLVIESSQEEPVKTTPRTPVSDNRDRNPNPNPSRSSDRNQPRDNNRFNNNDKRSSNREHTKEPAKEFAKEVIKESIKEPVKIQPVVQMLEPNIDVDRLKDKEAERAIHKDDNRPRKNLNRDQMHHNNKKSIDDKNLHQPHKTHDIPPKKNLSLDHPLPRHEKSNPKITDTDLLSRPLKDKRPFEKTRSSQPVERQNPVVDKKNESSEE